MCVVVVVVCIMAGGSIAPALFMSPFILLGNKTITQFHILLHNSFKIFFHYRILIALLEYKLRYLSSLIRILAAAHYSLCVIPFYYVRFDSAKVVLCGGGRGPSGQRNIYSCATRPRGLGYLLRIIQLWWRWS